MKTGSFCECLSPKRASPRRFFTACEMARVEQVERMAWLARMHRMNQATTDITKNADSSYVFGDFIRQFHG